MKKLFLLCIASTAFSCSDDNATANAENREFLNQVKGIYTMDKIISDIPIDLNYDGIAGTDIMAEIDCFSGYQIINGNYLIKDEIISRPTSHGGDFNSLEFSLPEHDLRNDEPYDNCYNKLTQVYTYTVNEDTKEITITGRNEEREAVHGILNAITWENNIMHYWVKRRYLTSDGWQDVTLHITYDKDSTE